MKGYKFEIGSANVNLNVRYCFIDVLRHEKIRIMTRSHRDSYVPIRRLGFSLLVDES
jgi:hypothetical protein